MNSQSPVEIIPGDADYERDLPAVRFDYRSTAFTLTNTGSPASTATVRAVPKELCAVSLGHARFTLIEMHWHTPAEHVIAGRAPMEMHLVHHGSDGAPLVVAFPIEVGSPNLELDRIFNRLPASGESGSVGDIELARLVGSLHTSFRYPGSLTTPPFDEGVTWIVSSTPLTASRRQIDLFSALFPAGNARETQPLNGRVVHTDVA